MTQKVIIVDRSGKELHEGIRQHVRVIWDLNMIIE
jgi:hypothetical protein